MMQDAIVRISVVVATRDRGDKIRDCVTAISDCMLATNAELIVVDNGSEDDTRQIIETMIEEGFPLHYVSERARGASRARNAGIAVCTGDIIAITDDDCRPNNDWLRRIQAHFGDDPNLDVLGGRVELFDPDALPVSIRVHDSSIQMTHETNIFDFIIGANMAFRHRVVERIGGFNVHLGPGTRCGPAEDPEFIYRAFLAGMKLRYEPDVVVRHNHGRYSPDDLRAIQCDYARGRGAFYAARILKADMRALRMLYWHAAATLKRLATRQDRISRLRHLAYLSLGIFSMFLSLAIG